ncbi:MAG: hypothetical protein ACLUWN_01110 [Clostridia bacterium]|jgi:TMP repeat family|nr:MAG TPA: minor tail protein [Caudoviricetes sp.]
MAVNGYLKIKTKIDNKEIDKGIVELENKIKKLQEENATKSKKESSLQEEVNEYERLCNEADKYRNKIKELEQDKNNFKSQFNGYIPDSQMGIYSEINARLSVTKQKYAEITTEIDKQAPKIEKVYENLNKIKLKQDENNEKISQFKSKIESIKADNLHNSLNTVGRNISSQISKIGKMAMAVIGIRTAWNAVRSAVSMVTQYNEQVASDFEYMRFCIANLLAPAVQSLIRLLYTLLSYVNAITTAWFGINLFGNSSVKAFQKMQKSASGTAKSAKEIQKSLQGFDEMNVLSDTTSNDSGSTGGVGGASAPSLDLSGIQAEIPEWIKWIIDNKDLILSTMAGIASGLLAWKLGFSGLKSLGIGLIIGGIVYDIQAIAEYLKDPSWTNFGKIIQGIGTAIVGLGILIGNVPLVIAGAITLIIGTIVKHWEQIKSFFQGGIDWLTSQSDWVHQMFGDTIGNIYDTCVDGLQQLLNFFDSIFTMIKGIFDGFIMFIQGVFTGDWEKAWEGIKKIFSSIWEGIKGVFFSVWDSITSVVATVGSTVGNIISNAFKAVVNAVLRTIENILNSPIRAINRLIGVINNVPGINLGTLDTFNLPRLAKGGIISQPTMAVVGEAGKEAVMPLENNTEWIDLLAEKLASRIGNNGGYYIIQLDSRTIQRGIAKRKQQLSFATNGR